MIFVIDDDNRFTDSHEAAEYIAEHYEADSDDFDNELDETYDLVTVCGVTFYPSTILSKLDPVAYRCAFLDWEGDKREDVEFEAECALDRMDDDDQIELYGFTVCCYDDDPCDTDLED